MRRIWATTEVRRSLRSLQPANAFVFAVLLCVLMLMAGCQISPRRFCNGCPNPTATPTPNGSPTPTPPPGAPGKLYVSDPNNNSILRFDGANTADGNLQPAATIQGTSTLINAPQHIFVDGASDTLYVANQGNVLAFANASTRTGDVAPDRNINGAATGLIAPVDVSFDDAKNLLYVADTRDVLVFSSGSTVTGNTAFQSDIKVGFLISSLFLDSTNNRLYLTDSAANSVHVYDNASTLNGAVAPTRTINGAATKLNQPAGVAVDPVGKLVVDNADGSIVIFVNAAAATGNAAPQVTISGANTTLNNPAQIAVNNSSSLVELFVANFGGGNVPIFSDLGSKTGNIAPSRNINGAATGLSVSGVRGITLDTTR
jgi:DNA-binding beta-propeller fold protein YncE